MTPSEFDRLKFNPIRCPKCKRYEDWRVSFAHGKMILDCHFDCRHRISLQYIDRAMLNAVSFHDTTNKQPLEVETAIKVEG